MYVYYYRKSSEIISAIMRISNFDRLYVEIFLNVEMNLRYIILYTYYQILINFHVYCLK